MATVIPAQPSGPLDQYRYSVQALAALVDLTGWPADQQANAVAVAMAESSGKWWVVNQSSGAAGLFQILPDAHPDLIKDASDTRWQSPSYNSTGALKIYRDAGNSFRPWEAFTTGSYLTYLAQAKIAVSAWQNGTRLSTRDQKIAQYSKYAGLAAQQDAFLMAWDDSASQTHNLDMTGLGEVLGTTATAVGKASADIPGVKQAKSAASVAELAVGAAKWMTNGDNIIRVVYVVMGAALVIGGLTIVVRPAIQSAAKTVPIPL